MSAQGILLLCVLALVVGAVIGHVLGFAAGVRHGRDSQWVDDQIAFGKRESARRNRLGQFRSTKEGNA